MKTRESEVPKTWTGTIVGVTPFVYDALKRELQLEISKLKKNEIDAWEEKNWRRKAIYDDNKRLLYPGEYLRRTLLDACQMSRLVPHFAKSKNSTYTRYVQSFMVTGDFMFPPKGEEPLTTTDLEPLGKYVGGQGKRQSGTKVWRIRPMLTEWYTRFEMFDPFGRMLEEELQELLEFAGKIIGTGNGRAINMGRFDVSELRGERYEPKKSKTATA